MNLSRLVNVRCRDHSPILVTLHLFQSVSFWWFTVLPHIACYAGFVSSTYSLNHLIPLVPGYLPP